MTDIDIERVARLEAQMEDLKEDVADVKQDIKELHSRITTTSREICDKIENSIDTLAEADKAQHAVMSRSLDSIKERVDAMEKWRYAVVGGAIAVGYLVGHLDLFTKFLK
jgi:hypothetical protein